MDPGLPQKLFLMADPIMQEKIRSPENRLKALLAAKADDKDALEDLFLATLTRLPTEKEQALFLDHVKSKKIRQKAYTDVLWAIVNTPEFIFNH